jgi:hypothetical protein
MYNIHRSASQTGASDDESFIWFLADALSECGEYFVTATAGNGKESVENCTKERKERLS